MPISLEQFVQQLEDSGILTADTIQAFLPPRASPKDAEDLARALVRHNKLSKFQAEEIYRGQGQSLVLSNYVLIEKIGAGGMGLVFKAEHRRMKRVVAIKLLPAALTKDAAANARFGREVEAVSKISHPNIVAAFDADCANGVHFLVMEWVDGSDLSVLVKKNGPLPIDLAVSYVLQAAKGLEAAHAAGIVHRDIKPANLLLDKKGKVKILDMGLARLSGVNETLGQAHLTSTGAIMGTVDFMAPEQALDTKTADSRADIYALGCTLYYLLTGQAVYPGDTVMKKLLAHREQPIPELRAARPEVSPQLDATFRKLVAKQVADRYQTMTAVIADLDLLLRPGSSNTASPAPVDALSNPELTNFLRDFSSSAARTVSPETTAKRATNKNPTTDQRSDSQHPGNRLKALKNRWVIGGGVLAGIVLLAGLIAWLSPGRRQPDRGAGELLLSVSEPDASVQILDASGHVEINRKVKQGAVKIPLSVGQHRLKVQKSGFTTFAQNFDIEPQAQQQITAELSPSKKVPKQGSTLAWTGGFGKPRTSDNTGPLTYQSQDFKQWVQSVATLPAEEQVKAVAQKLVDLNPGFDGQIDPGIENGILTGLRLRADAVTDISPVKALVNLKAFSCGGSAPGASSLSDLRPLQGLPLTTLALTNTQVADLTPLSNMPLQSLQLEWTLVSDLTPLKTMPLVNLDIGATQVKELTALAGRPLTRLCCNVTPIQDLAPLKGLPLQQLEIRSTSVREISVLINMPLEVLNVSDVPLTSLSPLKSLPLKHLSLDFRPLRDTQLLRSIQTLETINGSPAPQFWKIAAAQQADFEEWQNRVAKLPADQQVQAVSEKLKDLNPGFDGLVTPTFDKGHVTELRFFTDLVTDISPVRALPELKFLTIEGRDLGASRFSDLSPLEGMKLTLLQCSKTEVSDLTPLRGLLLTDLAISHTKVTDLTPIKDLPLTGLAVNGTGIQDLSPIQEKLLTNIYLDFQPQRDTKLLRSMTTLGVINGLPPAEFWKSVDLPAK